MSTLYHFTFRIFLILTVLLVVRPSRLNAQEPLIGFVDLKFVEEWEKFDFTKDEIGPEQVKNFDSDGDEYGEPLDRLQVLRAIVFGRHGRVFKKRDIQQGFLEHRPWYKPDPKFQNAMLNDTERKNLDIIREAEAREHEHIELGDMRFYRDRFITEGQLGEHSRAEYRILRAEIEAIHGKRFDDEPWIQRYFEERYWYKPSEKYDPKQLTETERKNLTTIRAVEKKQSKFSLLPGDMDMFQNKLITEDMLHGLGLYELRILRNEVYALRGCRFRTEWIQTYFNMHPWYEPMKDFREPELSPIEIKNIATIVKLERRIHDELSTKSISESLLDGLFLEDASKLRDEIYARRGKVFENKWLQNYFSSFNWYKPNPNFSEGLLNEIERKNVEIIRAYEENAIKEQDAFEP